MRGTSAASALSVLHDSSMAPSRSLVFGKKWSVTQAMSQPVRSRCCHSSSTPDQVCMPMLVNNPKRISDLLSARLGAGEARGLVDAARAAVARHLWIRTQRSSPHDLAILDPRGGEAGRGHAALDPVDDRGHRVEAIGTHAAAAVEHAGDGEEPEELLRVGAIG